MVFGDLQLINELGAVDARLVPQYRLLLSGGEKETGSKARVSVKKGKVSPFSSIQVPCV